LEQQIDKNLVVINMYSTVSIKIKQTDTKQLFSSDKQAYKVLESVGQLHALGLILNKTGNLIEQYPAMDYRQAPPVIEGLPLIII
jgi:hypothetical protein